jgi:hypothetical protein
MQIDSRCFGVGFGVGVSVSLHVQVLDVSRRIMYTAYSIKRNTHSLSINQLLFTFHTQDPDLVPAEQDCDDPDIVKGEVRR